LIRNKIFKKLRSEAVARGRRLVVAAGRQAGSQRYSRKSNEREPNEAILKGDIVGSLARRTNSITSSGIERRKRETEREREREIEKEKEREKEREREREREREEAAACTSDEVDSIAQARTRREWSFAQARTRRE